MTIAIDFDTDLAVIRSTSTYRICVGPIPGRKSIALYREVNFPVVAVEILGWFSGRDEAQTFVDAMHNEQIAPV